MAAWSDRIRWGVIEDARWRQGRERRRILVVLMLVVVVAVPVAFGLAGVSATRYGVPSPGRVTGSLRSLSPADYHYWVTPTLNPGDASLDISAQDSETSASCVGGCASYVGASVPLSEIRGDAGGGGSLGAVVRAPLPRGIDPNYVLLVASNVAAVRIGDLGTVGSQAASGLPLGDRVAAFRAPQNTSDRRELTSVPAQTLIALDSRGYAIATLAPVSLPTTRAWVLRERARYRREQQLITTHRGRCAVTSQLAGLADQAPLSSTSITAIAPTAPGLLLSCMEDKYSYQGSEFNVAILLNAHHPGARPPGLWGSIAVPGHPGVVEIAQPELFAGENASAPLYARRVGNAWLVVQARPGFAPNPSPSERLRVLEGLRITRLDLARR